MKNSVSLFNESALNFRTKTKQKICINIIKTEGKRKHAERTNVMTSRKREREREREKGKQHTTNKAEEILKNKNKISRHSV
jgi:hypothetical protein